MDETIFYLICSMDDANCNPLQTNLYGRPLRIFTDESKAKDYGKHMAEINCHYKIRGFVQCPGEYQRLHLWIDFSE